MNVKQQRGQHDMSCQGGACIVREALFSGVLFLLLLILSGPAFAGEQKSGTVLPTEQGSRHQGAKGGPAQAADKQLHAQHWAFETGRSARFWGQTGLDGDELMSKATGHSSASPKAGASEYEDRAEKAGWETFRLSVDRESSSLQREDSKHRADEDIKLESQHRVRAFATMKQDNDVYLGIGPEVIVRDNQQTNRQFNPSRQPDVDAGVGMRFMLDF